MLFQLSETEMTQTKSTRCFVCLVVFMLSLIGLPYLYAQTGSGGTIQGTITDPEKAVIANAKMTVTNVDTGVVTTVQSTSAGYYVAPALIPGLYSRATCRKTSASTLFR
jgi:hypothetical protein